MPLQSKCTMSYEEYQNRRKQLMPYIQKLKKEQFTEALTLFDTMKKMAYPEKIEYTEKIITNAVATYGDKLVCTCSFGKDSTLMLYFALQADPNIKVLFCNTGIEHKKTYEFRDYLIKKWKLNFFETLPVKSFWECVNEYGYPNIRYNKRGRGGTPKCCYYLKERPAANWYGEHKTEAILLGITWDESYQRKMTLIKYGDNYKTKKNLKNITLKILPIAFWNENDVWKYTQENNIPHNEIYDLGISRCGCLPCTAHLGWKKQISQLSPHLLSKILHDHGQKQIKDFGGGVP